MCGTVYGKYSHVRTSWVVCICLYVNVCVSVSDVRTWRSVPTHNMGVVCVCDFCV